jgi:hypothetical protein
MYPVYYSLVSCKVRHSLGDGKYGFLDVFFFGSWMYLQIIKYVQMTIVCQLSKIGFSSRLIWLAVLEMGGEHRAW